MKVPYLLLLAFVFAFTNNTQAQQEIFDAIVKMQEAKDASGGKDICTESFFNRRADSGKRFTKMFVERNFNLNPLETKYSKAKDRAVIKLELSIVGRDKAPEVNYMFAVKEGGKWLMDGYQRGDTYGEAFLAGAITGHFQTSEIPEDGKVKAAAMQIIVAHRDPATLDKAIDDIFSEKVGSYLYGEFKKYATGGFSYNSSGYLEFQNIGYICYNRENSDQKFYTIYFRKEEGSDKLIWFEGNEGDPYERTFFPRER